jgi:hypothetical protein
MKDSFLKAFGKSPDAPKLYESSEGKDSFKGDYDPDDTRADAPELDEGHYSAAKEMMDCYKSGDHKGMASALHSFVKMIK